MNLGTTIAVLFIPLLVETRVFTSECIVKADYSSCTIFNSCCDFRCSRSRQKRSTCTINGTGIINSVQTECVCTTTSITTDAPTPSRRSKHSRLDLIAGVLFLFVLDMLLLSFTF